MPAKRRLQSTSHDSSFSGESPYSKRRRKSVTNQSDLAQSIFDVLKDFEDENGHLIAETFMKLPSKRHNPEYYEKIEEPVDLTRIGQRIRMDEYRDLELLTRDIQLMINNAKVFYSESSQEYTDACNLWEIYLSTKARILEEAKAEAAETVKPKSTRRGQRQRQHHSDEAPSDNEPDLEAVVSIEDMKEIYEHLVTETDEKGRVIADMFLQLPDQSNVQYYEIIKEPIDFLTIGDKLEEEKYKSLNQFEKDVKLLVKNAKTFNEPNSQIYDDAVTLGHLMKDKILDIEKSKRPEVFGTKFSARIKHRRSWKTADRKEKDSSTAEVTADTRNKHDASIDEPDENDFQAQLYNNVVNFRNNLGHTISDPFVRLPNKRFYPMYYEEIKDPISLKIIRKKILSKKYKTCYEVRDDFRLLFENAKQFNIASSQIHKDAEKLLKFMESIMSNYASKEEDLLENMMSVSDDGDDTDDEEAAEEVDEEPENDVKPVTTTPSAEAGANDSKQKTKRRKKKNPKSAKDYLQQHLRALYDTVLNAQDEDGREMITLFLEKPSRKDYPDYYKLVLEPIDMKMIDKKIRQDKYPNVEEMLEDFSLMFNNARHYNEPGSEVYNDAEELEKLLLAKHAELGPPPEAEEAASVHESATSPSKSSKYSLEFKLNQHFTRVRDYADPTQRLICEIFMQLPTKQELPDYYKVIRKPMEMDRIQQRMQGGQYVKLEEMLMDMLLMFENACVYNEPGSLIYKDALVLQKVAVETYYELEEIEQPASASSLVHEILTSLFLSVVGHQDENGRCYSESLNAQENVGKNEETVSDTNGDSHRKENHLTLEVIKKNLRNGRYKRLDVFQDHMFEVFEDARNGHRTDSEVYEDAVESQKFFIKIRDELCKNGETLLSPALTFTRKMLDAELDQEKKEKMPMEAKEDEEIREEGEQRKNEVSMSAQSQDMDYQGTKYQVGDFVYVENPERNQESHVVCIEKLYTDETGERRLYGSWFLRPEATFHYPSKKFILKEVFKSDYYNTVPVSLIRGRCFVMLIKDYFKLKPIGYNDEDVYVCESRYSSRSKTFKRIKFLQLPPNNTELVQRETPLPIIRMPSCYTENKQVASPVPQEKSQSSLMQDPDPSWPFDEIDKERENIKTETQNPNSEATYYSQYFTRNMWLKLGDCVYVRQPNEPRRKIARIERMWTDSQNNVWLHGPWFVHPEEIDHEPTKIFFKRELFLSSLEDTFPVAEVEGKCLVMAQKDYCACRPTQVLEDDIYLYESKYVEQEKIVKRIKVKRYAPTFKSISQKSGTRWYYWETIYNVSMNGVVDDEYYYYKKPIPIRNELSPLLMKLVGEELLLRETEAKSEVIEAPAQNEVPQASSVPGYPPQPLNAPHGYPQQMPPQVPPGYVQSPHVVTQYQASPYTNQPFQGHRPPGQMVHPPLPGAPVPPVQYQTQSYVTSAGYPSPHTSIAAQHVQHYQNSPQPFTSSPHPGVVAASPGVFQSPQDSSRPPSVHPEAAPTPPPKKKGRSGHSTGYILFASHCHPRVRAEHPDMAFGEISKIVGEEWRNLEEDKKREYEEKAREQMAKLEAEGKIFVKKKKKKKDAEDSPAAQTPTPQGTPQPQAQYPTSYQPGQYPNLPHQGATPQHRMPAPAGNVAPHSAPPGSYPSSSASPMPAYSQTPSSVHIDGQPVPEAQQQQVMTAAEKHRLQRGPLFIGPPPKAQRVMHSEAYLRYIEGLEKGSKTVSNWERSLKVKESDVNLSREDEAKLPAHWLGNGKGQYETTKAALWALRNFMLKDALAIKNHLAG